MLGVTLIERTRRSVVVTPLGRMIAARGRETIAYLEDLVDLARAGKGELSGPVNLGIIPTIAPYLLPALVAVTARAFAPLSNLLPFAAPFIDQGALGLFLKGKTLDDELTQSSKEWRILADRVPSASDPAGCILRVRKLGHDHSKSD